jgi:CheY-like chemotaxis protein
MSAQAPRKILVVDDDADTGQNFAAFLQTLGHEPHFITDPRAVLGTVKRTTPDAVFLDIGMPDLDGFQLASILKREFRHICVVAISGHESEEYRKRGREAGFDAYVAKPIDVPLVQSILDTLFALRPLR